jgi:hypothetical protein
VTLGGAEVDVVESPKSRLSSETVSGVEAWPTRTVPEVVMEPKSRFVVELKGAVQFVPEMSQVVVPAPAEPAPVHVAVAAWAETGRRQAAIRRHRR